jgi:hypothetical protein
MYEVVGSMMKGFGFFGMSLIVGGICALVQVVFVAVVLFGVENLQMV